MSQDAPSPLVLISCGEPSGDVYAAQIAQALRRQSPRLRLAGVGGPRLASAGVPLWADLDELSVMGFAEVVRHLPRLRRLRNALVARAVEAGAELLVAVDYPGFHLQLAGALQRHGIPTLQVIPPKTWSWGAWRLRGLRRAVRRCAVIFPFEEEYYRAHGIDARFVGHPLVDLHRQSLSEPQPTRTGLLLAPGSRRQELARVGPVLGEAAARLAKRQRVASVVISRAPSVQARWLAPLLERCPQAVVDDGPLLPLLRRAEVAAVTSGTATMEAALARVPHAIVYRTSPPTYWMARTLITVPFIGMANIVLQERVFPEFVQGQLKVEPLAATLEALLDTSSPQRKAEEHGFDRLATLLGEGGAAGRIATMAAEMLPAEAGVSRCAG